MICKTCRRHFLESERVVGLFNFVIIRVSINRYYQWVLDDDDEHDEYERPGWPARAQKNRDELQGPPEGGAWKNGA